MKKRFILTALTAALLVSVAGCGEKEKTNAGNGDGYTYTMTMYQTRNSNPDSVMKKKIEEKYNIKLNIIDIEWQKYDEILNLKIAGGEVPDILYAKTPTAASKYVQQNVVGAIPIELLEEKAPNLLKRIEDSSGDIMKYYYIDGELYSIPEFSVGADPSGIPMVWRGDWLEKVGITKTPETLDEFEEAFYKFANEDPDGNGVKDTYGLSTSGLTSIFASYGYVPALGYVTGESAWQERDGKLVFAAIQPEMKTALERISKWYKDGVLDPEFITGENKGGYWAISHQFINGIIGFTSHGNSYHWEPVFYADAEANTAGQDTFEFSKLNPEAAKKLQISARVPQLVAGEEKTYGTKPRVKAERWMFSKELVEDKAKFEYLLGIYNDIYASKENFDFVRNGEQGVVWDYEDAPAVGGGSYKRSVYLGEWKDDKYRNDNMFSFAPFTPVFVDEETYKTPREDWAIPRGFATQYMPYTELMAPLPSSSMYSAELTKIEEEAYTDIITGEKPIEYFDEFVAKWRVAGGEVLEKEANSWYKEITSNH